MPLPLSKSITACMGYITSAQPDSINNTGSRPLYLNDELMKTFIMRSTPERRRQYYARGILFSLTRTLPSGHVAILYLPPIRHLHHDAKGQVILKVIAASPRGLKLDSTALQLEASPVVELLEQDLMSSVSVTCADLLVYTPSNGNDWECRSGAMTFSLGITLLDFDPNILIGWASNNHHTFPESSGMSMALVRAVSLDRVADILKLLMTIEVNPNDATRNARRISVTNRYSKDGKRVSSFAVLDHIVCGTTFYKDRTLAKFIAGISQYQLANISDVLQSFDMTIRTLETFSTTTCASVPIPVIAFALRCLSGYMRACSRSQQRSHSTAEVILVPWTDLPESLYCDKRVDFGRALREMDINCTSDTHLLLLHRCNAAGGWGIIVVPSAMAVFHRVGQGLSTPHVTWLSEFPLSPEGTFVVVHAIQWLKVQVSEIFNTRNAQIAIKAKDRRPIMKSIIEAGHNRPPATQMDTTAEDRSADAYMFGLVLALCRDSLEYRSSWWDDQWEESEVKRLLQNISAQQGRDAMCSLFSQFCSNAISSS